MKRTAALSALLTLLAAVGAFAQEKTSRFAQPVPPQQAADLKRQEDAALERADATVREMQAIARTAPEKELAAKDARILGEIRRIVVQRQAARNAAAGPLGAAQSSSSSDSSSALMAATQQMQEMQMSFNLQYLMLQEAMQNESRNYAAMSNVMKTKQDTATNIIGNIK